MKSPAAILLALALVGCAPASVSQSVIAKSSLNRTTVGGPGYPLIVEGAESIGLNPVIVAQNMRFPARLGAGGSFRAINPAQAPALHAHLRIQPGQPLASSTLTFVDGYRRLGVGTFSIAPAAYRDPQALGSVSATLITDMLNDAAQTYREDDRPWWLFY